MPTISKHGKVWLAAIGMRDVIHNPRLVEGTMTTIWGRLERIAKDPPKGRWLQVITVVPGSVAIRTRIFVDEKILIARGIEEVALSDLREGEFVEVTFRSARSGLVKADTICAQVEPGISESKSSPAKPPETSSQSSMQAAHEQ
jgi:hypothetical protein